VSIQFLVLAFHISLVATVFSFGLEAQETADVRILVRQPRLRIMSLPDLTGQRARVP
jgi:hypothetical protein